ncbi:MAG TPA: LuxR C-terminal-related transcriptional regulator [Negativicutes bacterium]|nr:LuxR C-terminal-related transcriptional regulator [Negativicutes bacterium]
MQKTRNKDPRSLYFHERITSLMQLVTEYPLTIVEAPMGYGKTTAIRELLTRSGSDILWLRIHDSSLSSFWNGFCNIFNEFDEARAQSLIQLQFPNDSVSMGTAVNILSDIELPRNTVVVIDDYHLAECDETNRFLEVLITSEMTDLHIILALRYTSFPSLEELKLKDFLLHVKKDSFELSSRDIAAYYKQCGISLKPKEAEELYTATEGWISALYLLMLNYNSADGNSHINDIYKLLDKVVYTPQPQEYKDFLLSMCILDAFTLEQAAYIWESGDPSRLVDAMVEKNAFITYDPIEKSYYMHSMLRSFLNERLERREKEYRDSLYRKASGWYLEKGKYLTSMSFSYAAGDFDSLLHAIELDKGRSFNSEYKELLIRYFAECPAEIKRKYPYAMLLYMRRMFTFNETELFRKACGEFTANLQSMEASDLKKALMGEYELVLSFTGYNDIERMSEFHKRACSLLKSPSSILDGSASWTFGSPSVLYMFHRKPGELDREVQTIREAMPFYYKITNDHGMGAELVMDAERCFYSGDFENAEILAHSAYQAAYESSQSGITIAAAFLLIRLTLLKGDFSAFSLLKKMREDISRKQWYLFIHTLDMCEAYIYSCLNIKEHIPLWISSGDFKNTRLFFPTMAFLNIVYGRVLLVNEEYLKLIGSSEHFVRMASIFPNVLGQIHTYIYLAAANHRIFRQEAALEALRQALDIAMPDRLYMPFVENCDYIKPLLSELHGQGIFKKAIERIFELYAHCNKMAGQIKKDYFSEDKPILTDREMEIALLAAEGLSNKEIGQRLFISQNTVKTQMKSIFEKLGINSRVMLGSCFEK